MPTPLLWWEYAVLGICWPLCAVYLFYILFIDVKRFGIPTTIREQLRLNGVMNVALFLHTELLMRPISYEWFGPIWSLPPWLPRALFATQVVLKNNIYLIYIPSAINRFTAFYYPVKHQHMWSCNKFRFLFLMVWTISVIFAIPSLFYDPPQFVRIRDGPADLLAENQLLTQSLSFILSIVAVAVTTSLSIACIIKYRSLQFRINRNLYECQLFLTSLTAYPPFLIYSIKCILELIAALTRNEQMRQTYTITWYWLLDIQTLLPLIPIFICSGVFRSLGRGLRRGLGRSVSPLPSSPLPTPTLSATQSTSVNHPTSAIHILPTITEGDSASRKDSLEKTPPQLTA